MDDRRVFSGAQAASLAGISERRLRAWSDQGMLSTEGSTRPDLTPAPPLYSLREVGVARVLGLLRDAVPPATLGRAGRALAELPAGAWENLTLRVCGRFVALDPPAAGTCGDLPVREVSLAHVAREVEARARPLFDRAPEAVGRIARRRGVLRNAPLVAGTRVPTAAIWEFHAAGYDEPAILEQYPDLTREDVRTALAFETERRRALAG